MARGQVMHAGLWPAPPGGITESILGSIHRLALGLLTGSGLGSPDVSPPRLAIEWSAPSECPDVNRALQWIDAMAEADLLETAPDAIDPPGLRARVTIIHATPEGAPADSQPSFRATVELQWAEGGTESRTLAATDCEVLGDAVALVVGVALDPVAVADALAEPRSHAASAMLDVAPPFTTTRPATRNADESTPTAFTSGSRLNPAPWSFGLRASVGMSGFVLPSAGVTTAVEGTFGRGPVLGRFGVQASIPPSETLAPGVSQSFRLVAGLLRGCWVPAAKRWRFPLCAGADAGAVFAKSEGAALTRQEQQWAPWAAVAADLQAEFAVGRSVGLFTGLGLHVSVYRSRFHVDGLPVSARTMGPVGFGGWVGVSWSRTATNP